MSNQLVREFYDKFDKRLINDFVKGNQRAESALEFVLNNIHPSVKNILDIGCGIGWSSYELSSKFKEANVIGIDISDELHEIATNLFNAPNLKFKKGDVTGNLSELFDNKFDVIILIDVYEHIPKELRSRFNERLSSLLSPEGSIILTCPTPSFLKYLKENKPEEIQPVDEDITVPILQSFAEVVDGQIEKYLFKSIWNKNDYFHCKISKNLRFQEGKVKNKKQVILTQRERINLVKNSKYGSFVTHTKFKKGRYKVLNSLISRLKRGLR